MKVIRRIDTHEHPLDSEHLGSVIFSRVVPSLNRTHTTILVT